jgi:hypothetical protein
LLLPRYSRICSSVSVPFATDFTRNNVRTHRCIDRS